MTGLLTFDDRPRTFLRPTGGRSGGRKLTRAVYALDAGLAATDYRSAMVFLKTQMKARSLFVLFTNLLDGHVPEPARRPDGRFVPDDPAVIRARGILVIRTRDFARQLTTFRGTPKGVARFAGMFASALWRTYRGRIRPTDPPTSTGAP